MKNISPFTKCHFISFHLTDKHYFCLKLIVEKWKWGNQSRKDLLCCYPYISKRPCDYFSRVTQSTLKHFLLRLLKLFFCIWLLACEVSPRKKYSIKFQTIPILLICDSYSYHVHYAPCGWQKGINLIARHSYLHICTSRVSKIDPMSHKLPQFSTKYIQVAAFISFNGWLS